MPGCFVRAATGSITEWEGDVGAVAERADGGFIRVMHDVVLDLDIGSVGDGRSPR